MHRLGTVLLALAILAAIIATPYANGLLAPQVAAARAVVSDGFGLGEPTHGRVESASTKSIYGEPRLVDVDSLPAPSPAGPRPGDASPLCLPASR